jgi:hypothetical protein
MKPAALLLLVPLSGVSGDDVDFNRAIRSFHAGMLLPWPRRRRAQYLERRHSPRHTGQCTLPEVMRLQKEGPLAVVSMMESNPSCSTCVLGCVSSGAADAASTAPCVVMNCLGTEPVTEGPSPEGSSGRKPYLTLDGAESLLKSCTEESDADSCADDCAATWVGLSREYAMEPSPEWTAALAAGYDTIRTRCALNCTNWFQLLGGSDAAKAMSVLFPCATLAFGRSQQCPRECWLSVGRGLP